MSCFSAFSRIGQIAIGDQILNEIIFDALLAENGIFTAKPEPSGSVRVVPAQVSAVLDFIIFNTLLERSVNGSYTTSAAVPPKQSDE